MDIIWSKNELNKIKVIILNRVNLRLDSDNNLITNSKIFRDSGNLTITYQYLIEEIEKLIYFQDRTEISRILENASKVQVNLNNRNHLGLITTLSRINPHDHTNIFVILKEIAAQYEKTVLNSVNNLTRSIDFNNIEKIRDIINYIKNSEKETIYEKLIKVNINKIIENTNGVCQEDIFKNVITKYDSRIKEMLINALLKKLSSLTKETEMKKERIYFNGCSNFNARLDIQYNQKERSFKNSKKKK